MTISAMMFRRSAVYMNKLVKISALQASLENVVRVEKYKYELETKRAEDLSIVYKYIENGARQGAVRVFNWDSTPQHIRKLLFEDEELKNYLQSNGFTYNDNAIEWYAAPDSELT